MDLIFELVIECFIDLITDNGIDIMTGSGRTDGWSKGLKITFVTVSLLIIAAIVGLLVFFGIKFWTEGDYTFGVPMALLGAAFLIFTVIKFILAYRRNRSSKKDRRECSYVHPRLLFPAQQSRAAFPFLIILTENIFLLC